jgi:alpha-L-fucosidase
MNQARPTQGETDWFVRDRFGMFIHWGLYALPARHEWVRTIEGLTDAEYQRYFDRFDPDLYDPAEWAAQARAAGMRYVIITAKHHDGFCLWDSQQTSFKASNTPYGKDLLRPFVDAFRAEGLRVGFYYSLLDWNHSEFPIDAPHPMGGGQVKRLIDNTDTVITDEDVTLDTFLELPEQIRKENQDRDVRKYAAYMREQVRELLTNYGTIDIIWFDFSYPGPGPAGLMGKGREDWESEELLALVRELQPGIIVNNRLDLPEVPADVYTPEQVQPRRWFTVDGRQVTWELCNTFSGSWGYHRDEMSWKSPEQLVQSLVSSVAFGGNLLMNVGPTARGTFDNRATKALAVYGEWTRLHGRAVYGCTQSEFIAPPDCRLTQNGNRLYLHVFAWPSQYLYLDGLAGKVDYAQLLNDASEIRIIEPGRFTWLAAEENADTLTIELPIRKPDVVVPVVELFLKGPS